MKKDISKLEAELEKKQEIKKGWKILLPSMVGLYYGAYHMLNATPGETIVDNPKNMLVTALSWASAYGIVYGFITIKNAYIKYSQNNQN